MALALRRNLTLFLVPVLPLFAALLALPRLDTLSPALRELLPQAPYAVAGAALLLSLRFHRGRAFLVAITVAVAYWSYGAFLRDGISDLREQIIFQALCVLVPFNLFLFAFVREKGPGTNGGILRLIFLLLQLSLVEWVVRFNKTGILDFFSQPLFEGIVWPFAVSQTSLLFAFLFAGLIAVKLKVRQCPMVGAFLGILLTLLFAAANYHVPDAFPVFATAAAGILVLGLLQDSYNMAFRDELTGLPSRRALNERMAGLGRRYAVAMLDIDHFKSFNDTYGHDVGDQVLRMVARKIQAVSGGGTAYRYGGEEFTVIFPRRSSQEVSPHLEELRKAIASYPMKIRGEDRPKDDKFGKVKRKGADAGKETVSVTISIGVAECSGSGSPEETVKAADQALYRAKKKGRNQVSR